MGDSLEFVFDLFMLTMWKAFSKFTCFLGGLRFWLLAVLWSLPKYVGLRSVVITSSKSADGFKSFNRGFLNLSNFAFCEAAPSRIVKTAWIVGLRTAGVGEASLASYVTARAPARFGLIFKVCYCPSSNPNSILAGRDALFGLCYSPSSCPSFAASRYSTLFFADSCFNFAAKLTLWI